MAAVKRDITVMMEDLPDEAELQSKRNKLVSSLKELRKDIASESSEARKVVLQGRLTEHAKVCLYLSRVD